MIQCDNSYFHLQNLSFDTLQKMDMANSHAKCHYHDSCMYANLQNLLGSRILQHFKCHLALNFNEEHQILIGVLHT